MAANFTARVVITPFMYVNRSKWFVVCEICDDLHIPPPWRPLIYSDNENVCCGHAAGSVHSAFGEDVPKMMTEFKVKLESTEIPKDSFSAQPKGMYRAGAGYCRSEENPDLENGIHGLLIMNEPDSWLINRLSKTARQMVDPGPTFICRMPIFAKLEDIKSTDDL